MTIAPPYRRLFGARGHSDTTAQYLPSERNTFFDAFPMNPLAALSLSMWSWNMSTLVPGPWGTAKSMPFSSLVDSIFREMTPWNGLFGEYRFARLTCRTPPVPQSGKGCSMGL